MDSIDRCFSRLCSDTDAVGDAKYHDAGNIILTTCNKIPELFICSGNLFSLFS